MGLNPSLQSASPFNSVFLRWLKEQIVLVRGGFTLYTVLSIEHSGARQEGGTGNRNGALPYEQTLGNPLTCLICHMVIAMSPAIHPRQQMQQ